MNEFDGFTSPSKSMLTRVVCNVIISFENTPLFDLREQVQKKNCENSDICQIIGRQGLLKPYFSMKKNLDKGQGGRLVKISCPYFCEKYIHKQWLIKKEINCNLIWFICHFSLASLRMGLVIFSICMNLIISDQDQLRPRWFDYQTNLGWKLSMKCLYLHDSLIRF